MVNSKKLPSLQINEIKTLRLFLFFAGLFKGFKIRLIKSLEILRNGLASEKVNTQDMFKIYFKHSRGQATKEDLKAANKQFRDIIKGLGLGVFLILPFAPITLPLIVSLGRKLGVEVLPDSFRDII